MYFHRPGRADLNAKLAGDTFIIVKMDFTGMGVDHQGSGRAYGNAYPAVSAFGFIADHILAQRLDLYPA